jgi:hypothetical protein
MFSPQGLGLHLQRFVNRIEPQTNCVQIVLVHKIVFCTKFQFCRALQREQMFSFNLMFYFSYQFTQYNDFITQILSENVTILPYISPDFFFWEGVFAPREISSVRVITLYPACDVAHIRVENIKRATYLCEYDVLFFYFQNLHPNLKK